MGKHYNFFHLVRSEMKKWKKCPALMYLQSTDANETSGENVFQTQVEHIRAVLSQFNVLPVEYSGV